MRFATLIDGKALLDVALVSFLLTLAAVTAFGTAVLAGDRVGTARRDGRGATAPWIAVIALAAVACAGILVLGVWAMTQK